MHSKENVHNTVHSDQKIDTPKCPLTTELGKQIWCVHVMECYSVLRTSVHDGLHVIAALWRQRQEEPCKFGVSLVFRVPGQPEVSDKNRQLLIYSKMEVNLENILSGRSSRPIICCP